MTHVACAGALRFSCLLLLRHFEWQQNCGEWIVIIFSSGISFTFAVSEGCVCKNTWLCAWSAQRAQAHMPLEHRCSGGFMRNRKLNSLSVCAMHGCVPHGKAKPNPSTQIWGGPLTLGKKTLGICSLFLPPQFGQWVNCTLSASVHCCVHCEYFLVAAVNCTL